MEICHKNLQLNYSAPANEGSQILDDHFSDFRMSVDFDELELYQFFLVGNLYLATYSQIYGLVISSRGLTAGRGLVCVGIGYVTCVGFLTFP